MTHFEYLSVVLSVVIGLALTRILGCWGELIRHRRTVHFYWPQLCWTGLISLMLIYGWWATWAERQSASQFTFFEYVAHLFQPSLLVLVAWLLTPAVQAGGKLDIRSEFFANTRWVFGLLALSNLVLIATEVARGVVGAVPIGATAALFGLASYLAVSRSERVHQIGALAAVALVVTTFAIFDSSGAGAP